MGGQSWTAPSETKRRQHRKRASGQPRQIWRPRFEGQPSLRASGRPRAAFWLTWLAPIVAVDEPKRRVHCPASEEEIAAGGDPRTGSRSIRGIRALWRLAHLHLLNRTGTSRPVDGGVDARDSTLLAALAGRAADGRKFDVVAVDVGPGSLRLPLAHAGRAHAPALVLGVHRLGSAAGAVSAAVGRDRGFGRRVAADRLLEVRKATLERRRRGARAGRVGRRRRCR
jgi:hypothetical protein